MYLALSGTIHGPKKAVINGKAVTTLKILQSAIQYAIQGNKPAAAAKYIPKDIFATKVLYFGPTYSITGII